MEIGSLGEYLRQSEEMPLKVILSNPTGKDAEYRRYVYVKKKDGFQREAYTKTQVFHWNLPAEELAADLCEAFGTAFRQCNLFYESRTADASSPRVLPQNRRRGSTLRTIGKSAI